MELDRAQIFPEPELPDVEALLAEGRRLARTVGVGRNAFLEQHEVDSELEYKRRCVADGRIMFHAQVGFRDADKTRRACAEIYEKLSQAGYDVDRYAMTFDRSMGYLPELRERMPHGTGVLTFTT